MKKTLLILFCMIFLCSCTASDNSQPAAVDAEAPEAAEQTSDIIQYDYAVLENNLLETELYGDGKLMTDEEVTDQMLMDVSLMDECFVYRHSDPLKSAVLMIFLPKEGNEDKIKTDVASFLDMYKDTFDLYAPEEFALVEDYYTIDKGEHIIYTVSEDNQAVINAINRSKK